MTHVETAIADGFHQAGCDVALHVVDLASGAGVAIQADTPVVLASVFKILVALEFYAQAEEGALDPASALDLDPAIYTAGPTGISAFEDPVRISARDLCRLMMSISDNTATDALVTLVGLDRINARAERCGCGATLVESDLKTLFDGIAVDIGFPTYPELLKAQSGALGHEAQQRALDPARIDACAALVPARTSRSTPRDLTRLLAAIWADTAGPPAACASLRALMAQQVTGRLVRALPDGATVAAKTGSLLGRVRNEAGVITHADGRSFAVAVFTRAHERFARVAEIETAMAVGAASAISALRAEAP